jgi:hypothetical protein
VQTDDLGMRNIFDQYSQPENRLTHALVSSLAAEPWLLRRFVRWVTGHVGKHKLEIEEQHVPGEEGGDDEEEAERRGLPDAWIHDGHSWALIIESKINAPLTNGQLKRHRHTAERRGFKDITLVGLVLRRPPRQPIDSLKICEWDSLYTWIRKQKQSQWTRRFTEYMEILERKLVADEYLVDGKLTVFSGIPFAKNYPYNYGEAKRLIRLIMDELRQRSDLKRKLGMNPRRRGRPAITGREGNAVWDFLSLAHAKTSKNFTKFPHLTLGIEQEELTAGVTVPNAIRQEYRHQLLESFDRVIPEVGKNLGRTLARLNGASPWLHVVQRRYPAQRAEPIVDATLEFDLRTALEIPRRKRNSPKHQPEWLRAAYDALTHRHSNMQLWVGASFPYVDCAVVNSPKILDHIASVWLACRPLIRAALGSSSPRGAGIA